MSLKKDSAGSQSDIRQNYLSGAILYFKNNSSILLFSFVFFIAFPFLYSGQTADPEQSWRFFGLSVFLTLILARHLLQSLINKNGFFIALHRTSLFLLLFFVVNLLLVSKSINPGDAWFELSKLFLLISCFHFLIYALKKSKNGIEIIVLSINTSVILFSVFAMIQALPYIKTALNNHEPFYFNSMVTSTFSNKNFFSETMFLCIPFAIYGTVFFRNIKKIICMVSLLFSVLWILILYSVSVWLACIGFLIFFLILFFTFHKTMGISFAVIKRPRLILSLATLGFILILILNLSFFKNSFLPFYQKINTLSYYLNHSETLFKNTNANSNSSYDRLLMLRNSLKLFKENPVWGSGTANWKVEYPKYGIVGTSYLNMGIVRFEHPHNDYLFILCESGIIGLVVWLGIFLSVYLQILRNIRFLKEGKLIYLMLLIASALSGFLILSLFGYPKERFYSMFMLIVLWAIPQSYNNTNVEIKPALIKIYALAFTLMSVISVYIQFERLKGEVYIKLALDQQKNNDFTGMHKSVLKAQSYFFPLDITSTPLNWYLGFSAYYSGNLKLALQYYSRAIAENPYHLQTLIDLGTLNEKNKQYNESISYYKRALAISPENTMAILNLIAAYFNSGQIQQAYEQCSTYPGLKGTEIKASIKVVLFAMANDFVKQKQDTLLANYLSEKLQNNDNFLLTLYDSSETASRFYSKLSHQTAHILK